MNASLPFDPKKHKDIDKYQPFFFINYAILVFDGLSENRNFS